MRRERFAIGYDPIRACWVLREYSSQWSPDARDINPSIQNITEIRFDEEMEAFGAAARRASEGDWMTWLEHGVSVPVFVNYSELRQTMGPQQLSRLMCGYRRGRVSQKAFSMDS
jgi:hypothetical protein